MTHLGPPALGRRFSAISLILAPLFLLLPPLALPSLASDPGDQIGLVSAQHGRYYVFVLFGIVGSIFMLPARLATMEMVRTNNRRQGVIGGGLVLFGSMLALVDWGANWSNGRWVCPVPTVRRWWPWWRASTRLRVPQFFYSSPVLPS